MARSAFASQKVENMKSAGQFLTLEVEKWSKNGTPLWRRAHLQITTQKTHAFYTTLAASDVKEMKMDNELTT